MRFDWYQASIPGASPEVVMSALQAANPYGDWEQMRPLKNYDSAAAFVVGSDTRFKIHFGGQNAEHGPNVIGSGAAAHDLAVLIRDRFPRHRVSRLDSCEDYHHKGAYPYLRKLGLRIAKECNVAVREITKPLIE